MVAVIAYHIILAPGETCHHAAVYTEARGKTQSLVLAFKFRKLLFKLHMKVERSVEKARAGTAGPIFFKSLYARRYHTWVGRQTGIGIATEHQYLVPAHVNNGILFSVYFTEIRIYAFCHILLRQVVFL